MSNLLRDALLLDTECVAVDTLVQLSTGEIIEIQDYQQGSLWGGSLILQTRHSCEVKASNLVSKGAKETWSVQPKYGLPVVASEKHLFLTSEGWKYTKDLTTNDWVLVNQSFKNLPENNFYTDELLSFIGWYIAEGCRHVSSKGNSTVLAVQEIGYRELLPNPWPDSIEIKSINNTCLRYKFIGGRGRYTRNPATKLLEDLNLMGKYSWEKTIPQEILKLSNRQLSIVLASIFMGDGTVFKDRLGLSLTTTSKRLAEQVVLCLQRFGILSSLSASTDSRKDSYKDTYHIQISGDSAITFFARIPIQGRKLEELEVGINFYRRRVPQKRLAANLSAELTRTIKNNSIPKTLRKIIESQARASLYRLVPWPEDTIKQLAETNLIFAEYSKYLFDGMCWVPIESIDYAGIQEVVDITVDSSEFFAAGVLVHNTLGLSRGEGLHEVAVYDLATNEAQEFILSPNRVVVNAKTRQEHTRLATSVLDEHKIERAKKWLSIIRRNLMSEGQDVSYGRLMDTLKQSKPWLYEALQKHPHLLGKEDKAIAERAKAMGLAKFSTTMIDPQELSAALKPLVAGKTIWGANVEFDAKALGAVFGGVAAEGHVQDFKTLLETHGPTTDPLYVTGVEVNKARALAQTTGDWTGVWKAYNQFTPKQGETAVRDIQDVLRAMMSYGKKMGMLQTDDVYWGTGLDLAYRLMGSVEDKNLLTHKEAHRAAEDLAIHSKYVLERAVRWTEALESVYDGQPLGHDLVKMAKNKQGALYEVAAYFGKLQTVKDDLLQTSLVQRVGRAAEDIVTQGVTYQRNGIEATRLLTQNTPGGAQVQVPVNMSKRVGFKTLDEFGNYLRADGRYGSEIGNVVDKFSSLISSGTDAEKRMAIAGYLHEQTSGAIDNIVAKHADRLAVNEVGDVLGGLTKARFQKTLSSLPVPNLRALDGGAIAAGAGIATIGYLWSQAKTRERKTNPSFVTYDYQQWLAHQQQFFDMDNGSHENGVGARIRHLMTDFGSPYQGTAGSSLVFHNQQLLEERERFLRAEYGVKHFDPQVGLFGRDGAFARLRHQGYSYLPGGESVENGYAGLHGNSLMRVNLGGGKWRATVQDADTVVVKRGGLRGRVADLFGMNKGYSFRLAGIDAPETYHAGKYGGAQPHAYQAVEGLNAILGDSKSLELVYDPMQTTYGRGLGVLVNEQGSVNYELVKRGLVGHLPFGKNEDSMIDYGQLKAAETKAAHGHRGMWAQPYWQAMYDVSSASGQRMTFNTLTQPDKIVQNISTMDTISLMEQAQAQGMYSTAMSLEASRIGKFTHRGVDSVHPAVTGSSTAFYNSYYHEALTDLSQWTKTHGTGNKSNPVSRRGGYGQLDKALVIDSMGHTTSPWSKRRLAAMDMYGPNLDRKYKMMLEQQRINNSLFDSQINHHRMQ